MERWGFYYPIHKKKESAKTIYLVCSKRGINSKICPEKAKFDKSTGRVDIYKKCINKNNNHNSIDLEEFKKIYLSKNFNNIDMNLRLYQKYLIECSLLCNDINSYADIIDFFKKNFPSKSFKINEDYFSKIKSNLLGNVNNLNIEEICKSLQLSDKNIIVEIYPINSEYKNKSNEIQDRQQNVILIGYKNMLDYLNEEKAFHYGLDFTFKIIPRSFKPYKLMILYAIDTVKNKTILACLMLIKYTDVNSLKKIFSLLAAMYNFSPTAVTTDFSSSQIKAIKECNMFKKKPYVISCMFVLLK